MFYLPKFSDGKFAKVFLYQNICTIQYQEVEATRNLKMNVIPDHYNDCKFQLSLKSVVCTNTS